MPKKRRRGKKKKKHRQNIKEPSAAWRACGTDYLAATCPYPICQIKHYAQRRQKIICKSSSRWQCRLQQGYLHRAPSVWVRDNLDMLLSRSGQQQSGNSVKWLCALRVSAKLKLSPQFSPFAHWSYDTNYAPRYVKGRKGRQGGKKSVKRTRGKKQKEENLGVLIRCDRCEMYYKPVGCVLSTSTMII